MNSLFRRFGKNVLTSSSVNVINKNLFKVKFAQMSDYVGNSSLFGAKKLPAGKGNAGGNKVPNVSSRRKKQQEEEEVEEEPEEVEEVKPKKKKTASKNKEVEKRPIKTKAKPSTKTTTKVEAKVPIKKSKAKKPIEEEEIEEEPEEEQPKPKKVNKAPKKAAHTVKSTPQPEETKTVEKEPTPTKPKRGFQKKKAETTEAVVKVDLNKLGVVPQNTPLDPTIYTNNPKGIYEDYINEKSSKITKQFIETEREFLCNNYAPLPVICHKGKGVYLEDVDGKVFIDFLSAYSAVNHGHCNEFITKMMNEQMTKLHMTSRAFYNNVLALAAKTVCSFFSYEKVLFMNSGVEAGESAVKIARRWAYADKKVPNEQAKIIFAKGNFWGRSLYACATSDDPSRYEGFGPFDRTSHYLVEYGNLDEIRELLEKDETICAVFLEPIQGENGVVIPPPGYLTEVKNLCKKHNVLMILDEIQTGIGRAGYLLASQMENVAPDMVLLGKSLSAGMYPVSAVLTSRKIMDYIKPGEHGSTYGGNPLAAQVVIASIQSIIQNNIIKNSYERGIEFGIMLKELLSNNKIIKEVRGRGLMYAIEVYPECGFSAYDFSLWLYERGLLCKPTKKYTLRLSPPLVITTEELTISAEILASVFQQAQALNPSFTSPQAVRFNIPSGGSESDTAFLNKWRSTRQSSINLSNPLSSINISHLNPTPGLDTLVQRPQTNSANIPDEIVIDFNKH